MVARGRCDVVSGRFAEVAWSVYDAGWRVVLFEESIGMSRVVENFVCRGAVLILLVVTVLGVPALLRSASGLERPAEATEGK